jgi:hypothetical protein
MKYTLEIKEEAIVDMQKAYDYYEENKQGLGERFLDTLDYYFERVQKYPEHYQIKKKPYREAFIKDFPYLIIYEIIEVKIIVYAVFNTHLDPKKKPKIK